MAKTKTATVRKTLTLSRQDYRYLEILAERGIHGSEWSGVARNFVEEGIRRAIKDGFVNLDED